MSARRHLPVLPASLDQSGMWESDLERVRVGKCSKTIPARGSEERNNLSGFVHTYSGQRDYSSRAWRPEASLRITGLNRANQLCLRRSRVTLTLPVLLPDSSSELSPQ